MASGEAAGGRRVLQAQRIQSHERDGSDARTSTTKFRAACRLYTQRLLAVRTHDVEELIGFQLERVSKVAELVTEAVAETNDRVARIEGGQDEIA